MTDAENQYATKQEVAFLAANLTIALRCIQVAFAAQKAGNEAALDKQLKDLDNAVAPIWKVFEEHAERLRNGR